MILIQARMSSNRLPGKVLMEIGGRRILDHLFHRCASVVGRENVAIITSTEPSDDPIVEFADTHNYQYYRGPLDNVYERFVGAVSKFGIDQFVRVCGDSPFLQPELIEHALNQFSNQYVDLVTNVFPRSYPKGQSVEVVRTRTFLSPDYVALNGFSHEHVTQGFYSHSDHFNILNFRCSELQTPKLETWAVDTYEDLQTISNWIINNPEGPKSFGTPIIAIHKSGIKNA
ncbi:cytidylyltransferase domain-containing protein [Thalassospira sp. HJ]|uniref:cytidylyltransferase domain-containing protein n=1 Tax=Thalassospira sp. HJ TaxID=1616823 RepID=UPI001379386B|nr:NTP transferase domain-containing protein [Thalassospira sp. HJ]